MSNQLYILAGNLVRFSFTFTDENGALADPTTVAVEIGMSYLDEVDLTPVRDSTGLWHADWDTTDAIAGTYYCECVGTGALMVAAEVPIKIRVPIV